MLRNIIKYLKKNKKYINAMLFVIIAFYGIIAFFIAFHNLDLLSNYALLMNDVNKEHNCDNGFYDIRDIEDCNGYSQCPDYKTIYIRSVNTLYVSFFLFTSIIMSVGFTYIKEAMNKRK